MIRYIYIYIVDITYRNFRIDQIYYKAIQLDANTVNASNTDVQILNCKL